MSRFRSLILALIAAVAGPMFIAGCSSGTVHGATDSPAVRKARTLPETAVVRGVLAGDPATGCLWIKSAVSRQFILHGDFGVDFSDTGQPVVRQDDTILARGGDEVRLGGGFSPDDPGVEGCPTNGGEVFLADSIQADHRQ